MSLKLHSSQLIRQYDMVITKCIHLDLVIEFEVKVFYLLCMSNKHAKLIFNYQISIHSFRSVDCKINVTSSKFKPIKNSISVRQNATDTEKHS